MLGYQHIYHAGNFADVYKHALLVKVLSSMKSKHPSLFLLDTHAGRGLYDFESPEAQKTLEFHNGIHAVLKGKTADPLISDYLSLVEKYNTGGDVRNYPGSPKIAADILRKSDKLVFAELHPVEFESLQKNFRGIANINTIKKDGFQVMAEMLPPEERQGVVVIDPSYEMKTDYAQLPVSVNKAYKKWPRGVFFIWYPILSSQKHREMLTALRQSEARNILVGEIKLDSIPKEGFAMYGTGIAIVNPPIDKATAEDITRNIAKSLPMKAFSDVYWLDNQKINQDTGLVES